MNAPVAAGRILPTKEKPVEQTQNLQSLELEFKSTILAQKKSQPAESETPKTSENNDQASESATTENKSNNSNETTTKPLKPFKPSEEIPAEQAVDFPVDI